MTCLALEGEMRESRRIMETFFRGVGEPKEHFTLR
jgi:hypothetical protein